MRITLTKMLLFAVSLSLCEVLPKFCRTLFDYSGTRRVRIRQIFLDSPNLKYSLVFNLNLRILENSRPNPKKFGFDSSDSTDQGHQNSIRRFNIRCRTRAHSPFPSSSYQRCHIKHPKGCANVWCAMVDLSCQQKGIIAWCHCRANSHKLTLSEEDSLLKGISSI